MPEIAEAIEALSKEATQASPEPSSPEPSAPELETTRDTSGELAPVVPAKDSAPEPAKVEPALKAPASWKPEEREGWEKLDARHQQAILRRERETSNVLTQSSQAREFAGAMQQTLQPYMHMIQSEQSNPVAAVGALLQTAAILRTAPPMQKASLIADLIMQHQVDPNLLDQVWSAKLRGQPSPNDPMSGLMQQFEQRLQPIQQQLQYFQNREQQQQQMLGQQASETLNQFMGDPANEFASDVAEDMADLLDLASKRGFTLSLQDAYKRATLAHPTISKIMERRLLTGEAAQQSAAASRARQASASISDSGAPSQVVEETEGGDIRSALTASIRSLSARR
jgi:hypothetical protein